MLICRMCMKTSPVHLVPYSCDVLVANAKKHPKNDDTSCTHRGERKRSHHRFCCTLVTPMRDPDRLMRSSLPHTWCQYSLSYQSNSPSTRNPQQMIDSFPTRHSARFTSHIYTTTPSKKNTSIPTSSHNFYKQQLEKNTTDRTPPGRLFLGKSQDALGIRIPPRRSTQLHGATSHPICCGWFQRSGEVNIPASSMPKVAPCRDLHVGTQRETWAWRGHHLGETIEKNGRRKQKLKYKGIGMCQRSITSCLTVINLDCAIVYFWHVVILLAGCLGWLWVFLLWDQCHWIAIWRCQHWWKRPVSGHPLKIQFSSAHRKDIIDTGNQYTCTTAKNQKTPTSLNHATLWFLKWRSHPSISPLKNPQTHQNSTHQSRSNFSRLHSRSNFSRLLIGPYGVISRFHVARGFNQIHSFLRHCGGGKVKLETSFREATCGTLVGPRKRSRWKEAEHGETAGHRFKPWPSKVAHQMLFAESETTKFLIETSCPITPWKQHQSNDPNRRLHWDVIIIHQTSSFICATSVDGRNPNHHLGWCWITL